MFDLLIKYNKTLLFLYLFTDVFKQHLWLTINSDKTVRLSYDERFHQNSQIMEPPENTYRNTS